MTKPFRFEGKVRMTKALAGIDKIRTAVDTLIVIPNDKLLEILDRRTTFPDAMKKADEVLQQAVQGITDLINLPAIINLDFADVQTVMRDKGIAHIGIGHGKGEDKASEAIKQAVESPLLETTISGATDVIINVSGDISLADASDAASYVQEQAGDNVNIIFGAMYDQSKSDSCQITVIATGIGQNASKEQTYNNPFKPRFVNQMPVQQAYQQQAQYQQQFQHGQMPQAPVMPQVNNNAGREAQSPVRPMSSYNPNLQSNVRQKSLDIPSFLQKKEDE